MKDLLIVVSPSVVYALILGQACGEQLLNYAKYLGIRLLDPRAADWCVPLTYRESRA
jgi:hypothetical protein